MPFNNRFWQNAFTLFICFLLVISVRFNRNDFLVKRDLGDARFYIENVRFFRGETVEYGLQAPFNERILVTMVASLLPFDPMTSINIVNVLFLFIGIFYLFKLLRVLVQDESLIWFGVYLFVLSFPTFYYSTIGYVDSAALAMIFAGAYAIYTSKYLLFLSAIALGTLAKEGVVMLIPVAAAFAFSRKKSGWYAVAMIGLLVYFVIWGAVKKYMPNTEGDTPALFWQPNYFRIQDNLMRINTYFTFICSYGAVGLLFFGYVWKNQREIFLRWKTDLPLWTGTTGGFALWFYTIFSAHTDGRFIWITYCFPIALVTIWWADFGSPTFLRSAKP